jgi:hypothetical protein
MQITTSGHLRVLQGFIVLVIMLFTYLCYASFDIFIVRAFAVGLIVFGLPIYFLHSEHYQANKGMVVEVDSEGITIAKGGVVEKFPKDNIKTIVVFKSAAMDKGGMPMTPFEYYFYAKIVLKEGKSFYLTSMLDRKIDEKLKILEDVPFVREKGLFAFL